jgi:hypothetical protein
VTLDYYWDEVQFQEEVRGHITRHATKGREEWKKDILGIIDMEVDEVLGDWETDP